MLRLPARVLLSSVLVLLCSIEGEATGPRGPEPPVSLGAAFEPNVGQTAPEVRFLARGSGYALFLTAEEAVMTIAGPAPAPAALERRCDGRFGAPGPAAGQSVARVRWLGARAEPEVRGLRPLPGVSGYFKGDDPSRWHGSVPRFAAVEYRELYPGIDLVFYFGDNGLEYDFVVHLGADPGRIRLEIDGPSMLELDSAGNLLLDLPAGEVAHRTPRIFQDVDGARRAVPGAFVRRGEREIGFEVAAWDRERPLVIDPSVEYATYLGGTNNEQLASIALDADRNVYVATFTLSTDFPTKNSDTGPKGGDSDLVIAKLDKAGKLVKAVYLGGNEDEGLSPSLLVADDLTVGSSAGASATGVLVLAGHTFSKNFPTTANAFDRSFDCSKPFKPFPGQVCVDDKCCAGDAIVVVFDLDLDEVLFSTLLGGDSSEAVGDAVLDDEGRLYLVGTTRSKNFPTVRPTQKKRQGGADVFVAIVELPRGGSDGELLFSTFLGGKGKKRIDFGQGIGLDRAGFLQVGGETDSKKFPAIDSLQKKNAGGVDAFLAVYDLGDLTPASLAAGSFGRAVGDPELIFTTFFGGKGNDSLDAMVVDGKGRAHLVGWTLSDDFPTERPFQAKRNGTFADAWLAVFDLDTGANPPVTAPRLLFSTYFGGSSSDLGLAVAVGDGLIHFGGQTYSDDLPTEDPIQGGCRQERPGTFPLCQDSFIARFEEVVPGVSPRLLFSSFFGGPGVDNGDGTITPGTEFGVEDIALDRSGNAYVVGPTFSKDFPTKKPTQNKKAGGFDLFIAKIKK